MTEVARSKRPPARLVFWASILLFATLFFLLAFRFSAEQATSQARARSVQNRKVIERRVVTTIVPTPGQSTVSGGAESSSSFSSNPEPVVTSSS